MSEPENKTHPIIIFIINDISFKTFLMTSEDVLDTFYKKFTIWWYIMWGNWTSAHKNRASAYKNRAPAQPLIRTRASENILEISHLIHRIALNSLFHNIRRCTRCGSLVSVGTLHLCDPVQTRVFISWNQHPKKSFYHSWCTCISQRNWFKWKWFLKKINEDLRMSCKDDSIYFWMLKR